MATDSAEIGEALMLSEPVILAPRQTELPQTTNHPEPTPGLSAAASLGGHLGSDTLQSTAAQSKSSDQDGYDTQHIGVARPPSDDGQSRRVIHDRDAIVGNLTMETRRYVDLCRAHQRLLLQAMSMCRYSCGGDKTEGAKLFGVIRKDPLHPLSIWLAPYFEAMKPLEAAKREREKEISKFARKLPAWDWAQSVSGLSDRFLGLIVGECSHPVGEFKSVAAVWKRMGLAVIDGERQRKIAGAAAIEHGYVARRRALMWNIGESLIKQQVRKTEDEERYAIGEFGQVYLDRKAYELERTDKPCIAHNRAKRYMEKRLLRELYKAWRAAA